MLELVFILGHGKPGTIRYNYRLNAPEVLMSGWGIIVPTILTFLGLGFTAAPTCCENIRAQEQQVLSKAVKIALELKPLPANEIRDISFYLRKWDQPESTEALFRRARESAAHANSAAQYADASEAANYILISLDQISPKAAQELFESWPVASSLAMEMALNEPEAETRISMASRLLPRYSAGTRLQSKWIEFGFNVLGGTEPGTSTSSSSRSEFENRLIGQIALTDFERAMSYIEGAEQPLAHLRMLIAVLNALDRESMRAKQ